MNLEKIIIKLCEYLPKITLYEEYGICLKQVKECKYYGTNNICYKKAEMKIR